MMHTTNTCGFDPDFCCMPIISGYTGTLVKFTLCRHAAPCQVIRYREPSLTHPYSAVLSPCILLAEINPEAQLSTSQAVQTALPNMYSRDLLEFF
jgi:hypothetical protein